MTEAARIITEVLKLQGVVSDNQMFVHCPNPDHNDEHPSCRVSLEHGAWICFSCGARGSLQQLGALVLGIPVAKVRELLNNANDGHLELQSKLRDKSSSHSKQPHPQTTLKTPDQYRDLPRRVLRARGFSNKTLKEWGCRWVVGDEIETAKGTAPITYSLAIPLYDDRLDALVGWCYRKTSKSMDWQPRYLYTRHAPLRDVLFGLNIHAGSETLVVVEGALDAMWVTRTGYPAVALLGSAMTAKVIRLRSARKVFLFPDRDDAGWHCIKACGSLLAGHTQVYICRYPRRSTATDPQELRVPEARRCIERAISWESWQLRQKISSHD